MPPRSRPRPPRPTRRRRAAPPTRQSPRPRPRATRPITRPAPSTRRTARATPRRRPPPTGPDTRHAPERVSAADARTPQVVIVGGGFGGIYAARRLARAPVRLTLVDRRNHHLF